MARQDDAQRRHQHDRQRSAQGEGDAREILGRLGVEGDEQKQPGRQHERRDGARHGMAGAGQRAGGIGAVVERQHEEQRHQQPGLPDGGGQEQIARAHRAREHERGHDDRHVAHGHQCIDLQPPMLQRRGEGPHRRAAPGRRVNHDIACGGIVRRRAERGKPARHLHAAPQWKEAESVMSATPNSARPSRSRPRPSRRKAAADLRKTAPSAAAMQ